MAEERALGRGFVYGDVGGMNIETVVRSIESMSESMADAKIVGSAGASRDNAGDAEPLLFRHARKPDFCRRGVRRQCGSNGWRIWRTT